VGRPAFQVADVFRRHGEAYREANSGHLDRCQRRVMAAIEACRTAALGGYVRQCKECGHKEIGYASCRDRHCPTCQGSAARAWLEAREADLLPVEYFHVVFTLPQQIAAIAYSARTCSLSRAVAINLLAGCVNSLAAASIADYSSGATTIPTHVSLAAIL